MTGMSEPFRVTVGMVLQRNWRRWHETRESVFDSMHGKYVRIVECNARQVTFIPLDDPDAQYTYGRDKITAVWFIPD